MTTVHDPGPEPASDAGLIPDPPQVHPAVLHTAEKAFWDAGGVVLYRAPFIAALTAALAKDAELDTPCGSCHDALRRHAQPDACLVLHDGKPCSCDGFKAS